MTHLCVVAGGAVIIAESDQIHADVIWQIGQLMAVGTVLKIHIVSIAKLFQQFRAHLRAILTHGSHTCEIGIGAQIRKWRVVKCARCSKYLGLHTGQSCVIVLLIQLALRVYVVLKHFYVSKQNRRVGMDTQLRVRRTLHCYKLPIYNVKVA